GREWNVARRHVGGRLGHGVLHAAEEEYEPSPRSASTAGEDAEVPSLAHAGHLCRAAVFSASLSTRETLLSFSSMPFQSISEDPARSIASRISGLLIAALA